MHGANSRRLRIEPTWRNQPIEDHLSPNLKPTTASDLSPHALKPELAHNCETRGGSTQLDSHEGRPATRSLREARANFETRYIAEVLAENDGNISRAALALGISRVALHQKLKDHGVR